MMCYQRVNFKMNLLNKYACSHELGLLSPSSEILRARFPGQNFVVKISHLNKSSVPISNIWLF